MTHHPRTRSACRTCRSSAFIFVANARALAEVADTLLAALGEVLFVRLRRKVVVRLLVADLHAEQLLDEGDVVHADRRRSR